jgi:single-strand DNA-binding protein
MNETRITVHGNIVSDPVQRTGRTGSIFTTFRLAHTPYRRGADGRYYDGETSYFSVIAFSALAANSAAALRKGQPAVVEGNLTVKQYLGPDGQPRVAAEIGAQHLGHDLSWGRATFERVSRAAALGHDRTADPDVQATVRAINEGQAPPDDRPPHVDADGVVSDDYDPSERLGTDTDADRGADVDPMAGGDGPGLGDPETDDYEVVSSLPA